MLERGETGSSLLELGFVRTGVPGTSQAHPRHIPLFSFLLSLHFSLWTLWALWKNTLEVLFRRAYLSWSWNTPGKKIGYIFWSIAYQSRCDALLKACLGYCIPQYAWYLWYPSRSTYSGKRDHIEGPNSHNCTQNNGMYICQNASDASFVVDTLPFIERGKDKKNVCLKEKKKRKK